MQVYASADQSSVSVVYFAPKLSRKFSESPKGAAFKKSHPGVISIPKTSVASKNILACRQNFFNEQAHLAGPNLQCGNKS